MAAYKFGVRVERTHSLWFGIGFTKMTEVGVVISLGFVEITIGKVFV